MHLFIIAVAEGEGVGESIVTALDAESAQTDRDDRRK